MKTMNYSVAQAKSKFSEVLHLAQNEPVFISNRGKEIGVLVSKDFYDQLIQAQTEKQPKLRLQKFLNFSKELSRSNQFPNSLNLPKRKNRKAPKFS